MGAPGSFFVRVRKNGPVNDNAAFPFLQQKLQQRCIVFFLFSSNPKDVNIRPGVAKTQENA